MSPQSSAFTASYWAVVVSPLPPRAIGLLDWATALGRVRQAGVEGTHSYGAALTRHLLSAGIGVIEVNQPDKAHRRRRGKTDAIDAEIAARAVTGAGDQPAQGHPRRRRPGLA